MPAAEAVVRLIAGAGLILVNAYFVAIEFALTRARQYPEEEFSEPALTRAWEMTSDLEIYLTSCQVGITASSIALGVVAEPALVALINPIIGNTVLASVGGGAVIAFGIINLFHLTHGEQTPTYLGVERAKFVCKYGATPLYYFQKLISPIISLGDTVAKMTLKLFGVEMSGAWLETEEDVIESRAELRRRLETTLEEGDISEDRREEVMNALHIDELSVSDIMVPREEIVSLSTEVEPEENFRRMAEEPHTRYPLVGEELMDLKGIVYTPMLTQHRNELSEGNIDFEELAAPPMTLPADGDVSDAIDQFQAESQELAFVIEDGQVVGMLTTTDAVEEVIGDMRDPIDELIDKKE